MAEASLQKGITDTLEDQRRLDIVRLPSEQVKALSVINPWKMSAGIAAEWAMYFGAVWLCELYWSPLVYFLTLLWLGGRLHALAVLMHDAAHYRCFKNRRWNDIVGEFLAWPILITLKGYRYNHFIHHQQLNSPDDPDWQRTRIKDFEFPKSGRELLVTLFRFFVGINFFRDAPKIARDPYLNNIPRSLNIYRGCFYVALTALAIYFDFWKGLLLYWIVPLITTFYFFQYIRSISEHYTGLERTHVYNHSRTVYPAWWEKWFLGPCNVGYHIDHHLYPGVPFYNLPKLHALLMQNPVFREKAHITHGYVRGVLATESRKK